MRRRVQTPSQTATGSNVRKRRQNGIDSAIDHRAESQRLCLLRRCLSPDRYSGARSGGPCRSVGGRVTIARRRSPASPDEPAGVFHRRCEPSLSPGTTGPHQPNKQQTHPRQRRKTTNTPSKSIIPIMPITVQNPAHHSSKTNQTSITPPPATTPNHHHPSQSIIPIPPIHASPA